MMRVMGRVKSMVVRILASHGDFTYVNLSAAYYLALGIANTMSSLEQTSRRDQVHRTDLEWSSTSSGSNTQSPDLASQKLPFAAIFTIPYLFVNGVVFNLAWND